MASFRRQQKKIHYVKVGEQLLMLEVYIDPNTTMNYKVETMDTRRRSYEWFKEIHLQELCSGVETISTTRVYSTKPVTRTTSMKYEYVANSWHIITQNLKIQCYFKKRSAPVQQFALLMKKKNGNLNGETRNKENNNYDNLPMFHEKLVAIVKQKVIEKKQQPINLKVEESTKGKEKAVKNETSSNYFAEQTDHLITSAVKRKKTSLKKIAKKSKIALLKSQSATDSSETSSNQGQSDGSKDRLNTQISSTSNNSTPNNSDDQNNMFIDLEEVPKDLHVRKVEDLRSDHLKYLINNMEEYLRTIFRGEVYCRRHEDYKKGGKSKDNLNFQVGMAHFTEDQHDCIMDALMAMFCYKHIKYIDYVTKVMFPEALIKLYQDVHQTKYDEAEEHLLNDTIW